MLLRYLQVKSNQVQDFDGKNPDGPNKHPVDPTSSKPSHLTRTPTTTDSPAAIIDCENFHGALIPIMILNIAYVCACSMVCILCIYY